MITHAYRVEPEPIILAAVLSPRQVAAYLGLSLATVWRLVRSGRLPQPIRLSPNRCGWRRAEIDRWLDERIAADTVSDPLPLTARIER
jgi:prophage regulatory protein